MKNVRRNEIGARRHCWSCWLEYTAAWNERGKCPKCGGSPTGILICPICGRAFQKLNGGQGGRKALVCSSTCRSRKHRATKRGPATHVA